MWNPFAGPGVQPVMQPQMNRMGAYTPYGIPRNGIKRVSGKAGADAYVMGPDDEVALFDETDAIVWLVQTDSAGYKKTVAPFRLTPYQPETPADAKSLEARLAKVEEWINEQSRTGHAGQAAGAGQNATAPAAVPES